MKQPDLEYYFDKASFTPNSDQEAAIKHASGPLYLMAGPGSGKTRVLLWRTVNLLVYHEVRPEEIFLSTFTEKAAKQLKDGLLSLLGLVTNETGRYFDISQLYVGTVHSLCHRLVTDRRFSENRMRRAIPTIFDELDQYFFVSDKRFWAGLKEKGFPDDIYPAVCGILNQNSQSRHAATQACIKFFNRFSEENIVPGKIIDGKDERLKLAGGLYKHYLESMNHLALDGNVDLSLIQQLAFNYLISKGGAGSTFKHVIIDEYQDTNTIQEKIFFKLAEGHKNLTVVGDDDQALYRFRGATVENFVQFPQRCKAYLGVTPAKIPLNINYRSRATIVDFYSKFINEESWTDGKNKKKYYRVIEKKIKPVSEDMNPAVITSSEGASEEVAKEIAQFIKRLIDKKKVVDPNQIAFLYPYLKNSPHVTRMIQALRDVGIKAYAPRAGRFLECDEPTLIVGVLAEILGRPTRGDYPGQDYANYHGWLKVSIVRATALMKEDKNLSSFVKDKKDELSVHEKDYERLVVRIADNKWTLKDSYDLAIHKRVLSETPGISAQARKSFTSSYLDKIAAARVREGRPFTLAYVINRATSTDWSVLDLFYRILGFDKFKKMCDLAERAEDEGPICNLALTSQYLARFVDQYVGIITGSLLVDQKFRNLFFMRFLYAIFRLGESEYEDAEDPFPKGRVPFLTIHQAKGLEFPVVVLGSPRKNDRGPQPVEKLIRPLLKGDLEPLDKTTSFDIMRMFYVALSRAKNLLVIANMRGPGISTHKAIRKLIDSGLPKIPDYKMAQLPRSTEDRNEIAKSYSYTSDYLMYLRCPRQYMLFKKYGFEASRTQTMFFGSLVHQTIEDLHNRLIAQRGVS